MFIHPLLPAGHNQDAIQHPSLLPKPTKSAVSEATRTRTPSYRVLQRFRSYPTPEFPDSNSSTRGLTQVRHLCSVDPAFLPHAAGLSSGEVCEYKAVSIPKLSPKLCCQPRATDLVIDPAQEPQGSLEHQSPEHAHTRTQRMDKGSSWGQSVSFCLERLP